MVMSPSAPDFYFSQKIDYFKVRVQPSFVRENRPMKRDYKGKVLVNALRAKDQKSMPNSHFPWSVCDVATVIIN